MLKHFIIAAGALLAATVTATPSAEASTHRSYRAHHGQSARFVRSERSPRAIRSAARVRKNGGRQRLARYAHHRTAIAQRIPGRHHRRFATSGRDQQIQRYVGPASSYERVSTPAGGAQVGGASYYGGRSRTASGGFIGAATCAHRSLPFGTRVLVTNLVNARTAILTVTDRGPFVRGRIVDVSIGAANILGMLRAGTARVSLQVVGGPG